MMNTGYIALLERHTTMKTTLHRLALRMGWYKDITTGLPLNVCKTVFGAYFLEGCYSAEPIGKLVQDLYKWGLHDGDQVAHAQGDDDATTTAASMPDSTSDVPGGCPPA